MKVTFFPIGIALMLLATVVTPSLVMGVFETTSMAAGILVVAVFFVSVIVATHRFKRKDLWATFFLAATATAVVFTQATFGFLTSSEFDFTRFWQSYLLLIIYILGAISFAIFTAKLPQSTFDLALKITFFGLLITGIAGALKYSPFLEMVTAKPVLFYIEPSHFALNFLPFLLYMMMRSTLKGKFILLFTGLLLAISLENLTIIAGIALIFILTIPPKRWFWILPVVVMLFTVVNIDYYLDRLNFSYDNTNLSTLVYMQGWERAYLNLRESFGIGIGFQQFGIVGSLGNISAQIETLAGMNLNLKDGGSVAPKFVGEFGVFGVIALFVYIIYFIKKVKLFFWLSQKEVAIDQYKQLFYECCFVMFFIDLFIRGTPYFSSSGFLFIASLWDMAFAKRNFYTLRVSPLARVPV